MKIGKITLSAKLRWLFVVCGLTILAPTYAQETLPAGTYVSFSTLYNGKRYYLGVDTVSAKAGTPKDTVMAYDNPNYATMWQVSEEKGSGTNYLRAISNVWLSEKTDHTNRYLALGTNKGSYSTLVLRNEANATLWTTENDEREVSKYVQGFLHYYSDASGVEVYRYLTYDPLYGFSRAYASRPAVSQRISIWDRKTGNDITSTMTPPTYEFGLNTTADTVRRSITSHVYYSRDVDRFRSRYDQVDVYARRPTVYDDQDGLTKAPYDMFGFYEWASNPRPTLPTTPAALAAQEYSGHSLMPKYVWTGEIVEEVPVMEWRNYPVMWASDKKYSLDTTENLWHDTIFALGKSPFDVLRKPAGGGAPIADDYADHSDWLRQHFYIKNDLGVYEHFVDSILIVRRTFHNAPFTDLTTSSMPNDTVFPYTYNKKLGDGTTDVTDADTTHTFTISALFVDGNKILYANNVTANTSSIEKPLDLTKRTCYKDTVWASEVVVDHVVYYDSLLVQAFLVDGKNAIIGGENSSADSWVRTVRLTAKNKIFVAVSQSNTSVLKNRVAEIRYTYRFRRSSAEGDWAESTRSIWITQKGYNSVSASIYTFNHKDKTENLQPVHEKKQTFYAIPGQDLQLLLHRDYWGYYRWFIYDAANRERDLRYNNTWTWGTGGDPRNELNGEFMVINNTTDESSRGRWDIIKDVANPTNPEFASDHFTAGSATHIPSVSYTKANSAADKTGKVACEVSAYYNIEPTGKVNVDLSAVTEPTLSYRQITEIRPAKEQADLMETYRGTGTGDTWMEKHTVIVPTDRPFSLIQKYPVLNEEGDVVQRDHLQYIYYFNTSGATKGVNMGSQTIGLDTPLDKDEGTSFSRIGERRSVTVPRVSLKLLTKKDLDGMKAGDTKTILLVNPRKAQTPNSSSSGGYALGRSGVEEIDYSEWSTTVTDTAKLRTFLMENVVSTSTNRIQLHYQGKDASGNGYFYLYNNNYPLYSYYRAFEGYILKWISGDENDVSGGKLIRYDAFNGCTDASRITGCNYAKGGDSVADSTTLFKLHFDWESTVFHRKGFLTACKWYDAWFSTDYYYAGLTVPDKDNNDGDLAVNQGWMLYEVIEEAVEYYEETPRWERSYTNADGSWTEVARKGSGIEDYQMLSDGNLRVPLTAHKKANAGETVYYRLRTEHFHLAKFTVQTRNVDVVGPSSTAVISEDSIQNHYDILFTLGNERFPAPGTTAVKAFYHNLPWAYTEMSYHYPVGDDPDPEKGEIPASKRVFSDDMPAVGEYAYLNKFTATDEGKTYTVEAMAGAENGYMLCIHAAQKPMTIFNFTYPQLPCPDQEIYLTFDLCKPVKNSYNPQVTAELQGKKEGAWTPLYRFKTGGVPYDNESPWHQVVLHIDSRRIADVDSFRCVASLNGTTVDNGYMLIDRLRFIARERPMSVFQNKGACLTSDKEGDVHLVARLDYQKTGFDAGTLIAYQYQKKSGASYMPLTTNAEVTPATGDIPAYINDVDGTALTENGHSYGIISIPATDHVPCNGTTLCDSLVAVGDVTTKNKCYVNEGPDAEHAYYVMYISQQVHAQVGDTFRVVMSPVMDKTDDPSFASAECAAKRIIPIDNPIDIHVSGYDGVWPNYTREELTGSDAAHTLRDANATYSVTAAVADKFLPTGKRKGSGKCMFDMVRTIEEERDMPSSHDAWFEKRFGCKRQQFREIMMAFRKDVPENTMRLETNWNNIRPENFLYEGSVCETKAQADSMYNILNRLIVDSAYIELGLTSFDVYLGDNNNAYAVFWPIPASGTYIDDKSGETRSISVCSTPRWFEIHSNAAAYLLRYGYDNMWAGDYYMTPVVRSSLTDATNGNLKVRVSEISSTNDSYAVAIGYNSTELIESNDPDWTDSKVFKYYQDKNMIGQNPGSYAYYTKNSEVTFTPQASGNTISLKAGYWYRFRSAFYAAKEGVEYTVDDPVNLKGYADFILAVAPDTVQWTPSHPDGSNHWNDDNNWTPVMVSAPADGFKAKVPMGDTKVIIPQVAGGQLPIVSDVVVNQVDTLHYGYKKNTCKQILFKPRATMLGQEKLDYEKAFVDVTVKTAEYMTFSPALKYIYAGDMYIPKVADNVDFDPKEFKDPYTDYSSTYNRKWPYALYTAYYNQTVPFAYYNTDEETTPLSYKSRSSADWVFTNTMKIPLNPGKACLLLAYDKSGAKADELTIRLPKKETSYPYISNTGTVGASETMPDKPDFESLSNNLAFNKTDLTAARTAKSDENAGITYTLTNQTASKVFFFGNPTMALIDVYKLCQDNANESDRTTPKLERGGTETSYRFTAYQLREGESSYATKVITGPGQFFVAPERSVGLIAASARTSLDVELKPSALVGIDDGGSVVSRPFESSAPRRAITHHQSPITNYLYMSAAVTADGEDVYKAYITIGQEEGANRGFQEGEDAPNLASGMSSNAAFETPLSAYTIADNKALMLDIRDSIGRIPVVFSMLDGYEYEDYLVLSFALEGDWSAPVYLYDIQTNDSVRICDGLRIAVRRPESDQIRYFINGYAAPIATDQPGTATGIETVNGEETYTIHHTPYTYIYDVLGRRVMTLTEHDLISNIQLPTGVYIIQRGNNTERMVIR